MEDGVRNEIFSCRTEVEDGAQAKAIKAMRDTVLSKVFMRNPGEEFCPGGT